MATFSHSRLQTFEQCKYRYKLKYIDKIKAPIEKSIESHLGSSVHDALEWLYKEVMKNNMPNLDAVIKRYAIIWEEGFSLDILIVKKEFTHKDYFDKGIKFIIDYYIKHKPFDDGTIETEKRIWVELEENHPHKMIGYIDRLSFNKETEEYEVHDYKTGNYLPPKIKFEKDRQLALYSIGIKQLLGQDKKVTLIWHYLSHDMKIISRRTDEQLEQLKRDIINLIKEIENNKNWEPCKTMLCNWCEYKPYCKVFGNKLPQEFREKESQQKLV